jgi:phosphoenolpyruvate---glycerone phosphotransferase subunit DhaL
MADRVVSSEQLRIMLRDIASAMDTEKGVLSDLDSYIGDGDHGVGMANGFRIGIEELSKVENPTIEESLRIVSAALIHNVGGVSGSIFGSVFAGMAEQARGKDRLEIGDFANMFAAGLERAQERGKAVVGDKTMIDALYPVVESLKLSAHQRSSLVDSFAVAAVASRKAAEETKNLAGRRGRAKYFREKAIGFQDAGATSVAVIVEAIAKSLQQS